MSACLKPEVDPPVVHIPQLSPYNDYVFCSSRGSSRNSYNSPKSIFDFLITDIGLNYSPQTPNRLIFNSRGGSPIDRIVTDIIDEHYRRGRPTNSHAYIIGGYVDLTYREVINNYCIWNSRTGHRQYVRYEEVIFRENVEESYLKAIYRYAHAARRLKSEGIRPVFATIPPSSLYKWNEFRLYFGRTAFLQHTSQYSSMQEGLMAAVVKINGFICKLNALNGMYTPYLAGTVVKTHAADGRGPILQYEKLYDGVHANDELIEQWAKKIRKAININRTTPLAELPPMIIQSPERLALILEDLIL